MRTILIVTGHYLPGFKAGGPIRTIANLVAWLGDEFNFLVLTADRDLHDLEPYANIKHGQWQQVGGAGVRYLAPEELRWWRWRRWLRVCSYDVLYLNGFFAASTRSILFLRRFRLIPNKPIILAPRGEFSPGALALKYRKKRLYLQWARRIGLYCDLTWQATSGLELVDIRSVLGDIAQQVIVASNLPDRLVHQTSPGLSLRLKQAGTARVVFLSRIARKKNLDFALQVLLGMTDEIELSIYGPIEDKVYWGECKTLIQQLPDNVQVRYGGEARPDEVRNIFSQHHLFLFPTRGENFGHVILEALQTGCPVLISDQTPWRNLTEARAGWGIPLDQPEGFRAVIRQLVSMDDAEFSHWSEGARRFGERFATDPAVLEANRQLFLTSVR